MQVAAHRAEREFKVAAGLTRQRQAVVGVGLVGLQRRCALEEVACDRGFFQAEHRVPHVDVRFGHLRREFEHAVQRRGSRLVLARMQHHDSRIETPPHFGLARAARMAGGVAARIDFRRAARDQLGRMGRPQGRDRDAAGKHRRQRQHDAEQAAVAPAIHTAPLCGTVEMKGTPKKVRKAITNTPHSHRPNSTGAGFIEARACRAATNEIQVRKAQVSSGSQAQ